MESEILKNEIFPAVLKRIKERKDSLVNIGKFEARGLEGWFKVEIVAALANTRHRVKDVRNKGVDLLLDSGIEIELKGQTNFVPREIYDGLKYGVPCLFLVSGRNENTIKKLKSYRDLEMLCYEIFSDGFNKWIVGLIKPRFRNSLSQNKRSRNYTR